MDGRKNETPKLWFRSDRVFRSDGNWFFYTREGVEVGPYNTQFEAEVESSLLINRLRGEPDMEEHLRIIQEFTWESVSQPTSLDNAFFTSYVVEEGNLAYG